MSHRDDITDILKQVDGWPSEDRVGLAYQILRDMRNKTLDDPPRNTLARALAAAPGQHRATNRCDGGWMSNARPSTANAYRTA
jgi:hypothetical protein